MPQDKKPIIKNISQTESENYLKNFCDRTFLSLWSYPSIFRDQGKQQKGDGKEICDLLVVFDNHVIIFSDKKCTYPSSNNNLQNWQRWYKRAVEKSAHQVWGAERWIKSFPNRVFIDKQCTMPFPIEIPNNEDTKYHRIVVAHDSKVACQKILGGSGSLMIIPRLNGKEHLEAPFSIGFIDKTKGYVHVLDDTTLDILLDTLDTITDFVTYIEKKENFIESGLLLAASGDEDLLGYYQKYLNENNEHDFVFHSEDGEIPTAVTIAEGLWDEFKNSKERKAQLRANHVSFAWDELIETYTKHIVNYTQYHTTDSDIHVNEIALRFLAKETRTRRRLLSDALFGLMKKTGPSMRGTRIVLPSHKGDPHYVFLLLPKREKISEDDYRTVRRNLLEDYCYVLKLKLPDAEDIIGIATETINDTGLRSEDLLYYDARSWDEKQEKYATKVYNELGLLNNPKMFKGSVNEYPTSMPNKKTKFRPNELCFCGSGKKYKKCHGKVY